MKHENLVKLIGITLIPPVLSLYTEFCDRGSLCYVLRRDSIPLNWSLRVGFLTDLANGLAFLHNYPLVHGRLCSTNCVISEKWTCKITDYGLDSLFWPNDDEKYRTFLEKPENLAYIAPEYREYQKCELVTAVDIYSFGTIMWEAATRKDPTEDDEFLAEPMLNHPEFPTKRCFETDLKYEATSGPPMEGYNKITSATRVWQMRLWLKYKGYCLSVKDMLVVELVNLIPGDYSTSSINLYSSLADNNVIHHTVIFKNVDPIDSHVTPEIGI
ncbi:unnamed protein product [Trichobilharzia regenti]|nr:unnamed protein product [Trichobilharzia regenti]